MSDFLDDDVQAAGDDLRDRAKYTTEDDDYTDYGFGLPFPPREGDLA